MFQELYFIIIIMTIYFIIISTIYFIIIMIIYFESIGSFHAKLGLDVWPRVNNQPFVTLTTIDSATSRSVTMRHLFSVYPWVSKPVLGHPIFFLAWIRKETMILLFVSKIRSGRWSIFKSSYWWNLPHLGSPGFFNFEFQTQVGRVVLGSCGFDQILSSHIC